MISFTKLILAGLIPVSAGVSAPFIVRIFDSTSGPNNKYNQQISPSLSLPLLTSKETDPKVKVFLELDSEHEKYLSKCKNCNQFIKRFKLRVEDKSEKVKNYDWMNVSTDGITKIVSSEDYKARPRRSESEIELNQKLKMSDNGNGGGSILLDLSNITFETTNCRWNREKKIECELDFADWHRVKLGETPRPRITFWNNSWKQS